MQIYTDKQQRIKEQFCLERGKWKWNASWETILSLNEDLLSAYSKLSSVPHKKGALDAKTKELIYIAMDGAITHMYLPGMKRHMIYGIDDLGITPGEIMETLIIASTLGACAYTVGFPILMERLHAHGYADASAELTEEQAALKEQFIALNHYWGETLESVLRHDGEIFEAYLDYMRASQAKTALEPKIRELLFVAVNAAPTTLNAAEIGRHIDLALAYGATKEELLEVFEVVCCLGIHTVLEGVPLLNEVLAR